MLYYRHSTPTNPVNQQQLAQQRGWRWPCSCAHLDDVESFFQLDHQLPIVFLQIGTEVFFEHINRFAGQLQETHDTLHIYIYKTQELELSIRQIVTACWRCCCS